MTNSIKLSQVSVVSVGVFLTLLLTLSLSAQKADAAIVSQLQLGSKGSEVTQLQQFLATNHLIYPQAIVSGVFGPLTQAAVVQFQVAYDIPQVGKVGPMTRAKINEIMVSGFGLDTRAPSMTNLSVQTNRAGAVINWTTDELASGQVFYDVYPIRSDEATRHDDQPYVSGSLASNMNSTLNSKSVSIVGLQSNTVYNYLVRTMDNSGNMTMTLANTFKTDY